MSAEQELRRARELVGLREGLWTRLLDHPPFAEALCDRIEAALADGAPRASLDGLREATLKLRERETKQRARGYSRARDGLAAALRDHAQQARLVRELCQAVREVGSRSEAGLAARKPPQGSRVFRRYLAALDRAETELERARQRFVACNLRLVVTVARRYKHPFMTPADLIQEGTLGLLRAVDGYDPGRGTRFSTYATWWIKHNITRAIANYGLTVRVPANVLSLRAQLSRIERQYAADRSRVPSDAELARRMGMTTKAVTNARSAVLGRAELPSESDKLADDPIGEVDGALDWPVIAREMLDRVGELPGIEGAVLRKRFALDGDAPMTLAEIGELHSLSRERIRQIEKQALRRMRGQLQVLF